jgi:hypothetical protein
LRLSALIALAVIFLAGPSHAAEYSTLNSSITALGMGDAFTAVVDDSSALFYNPAGLARVSGINWKIFSLRVGGSGYEAYEQIKDLDSSGSGYSDAVAELYGEHVWSGAGAETAFSMPMVAFAIYDHADALIKVDNPVNPQIYTSVINDYGYTAGIGAPFGPFLQAGIALKYIKRTGSRLPYGASFLADLNSDAIYSNVTAWGTGYGADAGINILIPAPFMTATASAVWRNMGGINFRSNDPNANIPSEPNDITLGLGLVFDMPLLTIAPALDFRYLNDPDLQLTRKINFGVEVGLPLLDIRGGFHEGYYTAGLGVNLGLFRVDAATYGVELGEYPGQIEDRRYAVEFSFELGFGSFTATGGKPTGGRSGTPSASGGGSGKSKSIWGGRRLKQRR